MPCGNSAIEGEQYCQFHLKKRTSWYERLASPYVVVPAAIAVLGMVADVLGIWSLGADWSNRTKLIAGVEFIDGGIEIVSNCDIGICGRETAGVSYDETYEPIFHLASGPNAGDCLALGFSLLNNSDALVRNVRAQVSMMDESGPALEFCEEFDIDANTVFPGVTMARRFSNINGASVASYVIDEIAPRNAGFFTVPVRNTPNLKLMLNSENLLLSGSPTTLRITHSADNSDMGEITAYVYLSAMSDKAQGLVDHNLLFGYHARFSDAIFSDPNSEFMNRLKSWFSVRPHFTEFVIGSYVSNLPVAETLSYSVPSEPILKQVVSVRRDGDLLGAMSREDYLDFKNYICSSIVQEVEGASYNCTQEPFFTIE